MRVLQSLIPIILGVTLCSFTEASFDIWGFCLTLTATIIFTSQNIYSKRLFSVHHFDSTQLSLYTATIAFVINIPLMLLFEGTESPAAGAEITAEIISNPSKEENTSTLYLISLFVMTGFCHATQNILAFKTLSHTNTLTYAIASNFKRVFVIVCSIVYFGNAVTLLNALGILLAIFGVILYNRARKLDKRQSRSSPSPSSSSSFESFV